LGGALAASFAEWGYDLVLMGRRSNVLFDVKKMAEEKQNIQNIQSIPPPAGENNKHKNKSKNSNGRKAVISCIECDVTDDASVTTAFDSAQEKISAFGGYMDLVIFNVAPKYPPNFKFAGWGEVLLPHQIDITNMTLQHDTQVQGLIRVAGAVVPGMIDRGRGCLLVSGESCCNLHGRYEFGSVAPARAAQRSLAQCMFQAYGPMGIHVCTISIGGVIDTPTTRRWKARDDPLVDPYEIAEQYRNVYSQKTTVWSYEVQLTPSFRARKVDTRM
jgi:NAD(P)-dependent dehydrogenase (short-subunit alcohol dehydrogenase family)